MAYKQKDYTYNNRLSKEENILLDRLYKLRRSHMAEGLERQEVVIDGTPCRVKVKDFVFLVEIDDLPGRRRLEDIAPVKSLIHVTEG